MSDTRWVLLRDLLTDSKDGDWGREQPSEGYVRYRVIRGADFPSVRLGDVRAVPIRYLPERTVSRRVLQSNDLLIETAGGSKGRPTGRTLLITNGILEQLGGAATCASFARFMRVDAAKVNPRFVYWYLQYLYQIGEMSQHEVQHTGIARFQYTRFAETQKVPVPPIDVQKRLVAVLGALDEKVGLNSRTAATLDDLVRSLFKSWFIEFNSVRSKPNGPDLPLPGPDQLASSFRDSELGEIPEGWSTPRLMEVLTESTKRVGDREVPEYSSTNDGLQLRSERFQKALSVSSAKNKLVHKGCLVFGLSRKVLNFGLMRDEIGSVSPAYKVFHVNQEVVSADLLERLMRLRADYFYKAVSSSSREGQSVSPEGLGLLRFALPPRAIQDAFYAHVSPLVARIDGCRAENRALVELRDTLLLALMSRAIRPRDAETAVADAT